MPPNLLLLILFLKFLALASALEVLLLPLSGCYSHDMMMREVGESFPQGTNVTWMQTKVFPVGRKEFEIPDEWRKIILTSNDTEGVAIAEYSQSFLWESYHPFDGHAPFEVRGLIAYQDFDLRHHKFCNDLFHGTAFQYYYATVKPDIIIVDFHVNDCMSALSSLFKSATVIHFSNWPLYDIYMRSFGVRGTSIAAYPETTLPFTGFGMNLFERLTNLFIRVVKYGFRIIGEWRSSKTVPGVSLQKIESDRMFYASRYQFLAEPVRPISHRIRFFGYNPHLSRPTSTYGTEKNLGENSKTWTPTIGDETMIIKHQNKSRTIGHFENETCTDICMRPTRNYMKFISNDEVEELMIEKFVLITFGSLARVSLMSRNHFKNMANGFGALPFPVIWQADQISEERFTGIPIPKNVYFSDWLPIKRMLGMDTLQFIVSHGGVNTLNEMLQMGVTGILMPLQGDQSSNAKRLNDLQVIEYVKPHRIETEALKGELRKFVLNLDRYKTRAQQFSRMLKEHGDLNELPQKYWLQWAMRHGQKRSVKRLMGIGLLQDWHYEFSLAAILSVFLLLFTVKA